MKQTDTRERTGEQAEHLTIEEMLDAMEATNGYLCVAIAGIGVGSFYRYNPGRDGFEQIESRNKPKRTDDGVMVTTEVMNYGIYGREVLAEQMESAFSSRLTESVSVEFVRYDDTPFPQQTGMPENWGVEEEGSESA